MDGTQNSGVKSARKVGEHELLASKYRLLRRLGEGAAATVWEAENTLVGRSVALKILHPRFAKNESERKRFLAEARAAARVAHPNVVDVYDFGQTDDGSPFIVMELLRGETLEQFLRARGTIPYRLACDLIAPVLAALEAAHDRGIVHRDLKPGNISVRFTRGKAIVKVLDFGIATGVLRDSEAVVETGLLFGTPEYMAPEQAIGSAIDGRTDLYAAGIILYELLAGAPPYVGDFPEAVLAKVLTAQPISISHRKPDIPAALASTVMSAIARDPARRPATARAMLSSLAPFCDRDVLASIEPPPPTRASGSLMSAVPMPLVRPIRGRPAGAAPPTRAEGENPGRAHGSPAPQNRRPHQDRQPGHSSSRTDSAPPPPSTLPIGSPASSLSNASTPKDTSIRLANAPEPPPRGERGENPSPATQTPGDEE